MKIRIVVVVLLMSTVVIGQSFADSEREAAIKYLTEQIQIIDNPVAKANNYVFRARNYHQQGSLELALDDYVQALHYNHTGWIWHELGWVCLKEGRVEQAYNISVILREDFPNYLSKEVNKFQAKTVALLKKKHLEENPPLIVYDTVAQKVRTRHDVRRELEAAAAAKAAKYGPRVKYDTSTMHGQFMAASDHLKRLRKYGPSKVPPPNVDPSTMHGEWLVQADRALRQKMNSGNVASRSSTGEGGSSRPEIYQKDFSPPDQQGNVSSDRPGLLNKTSGGVMNRTAGGYIDPQSGQIYHDAAGGIINSRTGQFNPVSGNQVITQ
ncbi:MAG: tetratricopeptide repeat protein [Desulfobulbaceae bacterium]|nr:tetratricopeptide repeat protein [Desulfobulbaceae bacterium]